MRLSSLLLSLALACGLSAQVPDPGAFLGLKIGADRTLADFGQITSYFKTLAAASPRVRLQSLGPTTRGRDLFMAVVSSPRNLENLPRLQEIARRLADPRGLDAGQIDALVAEGRPFLLVTCSLHAREIGASQMSLEWAHALATTEDPQKLRWLDQVVLLLVPSLNPDGLEIEIDWYRKQLGTTYEGGDPPWPYHPYAGHDNNRDWFMLNLKETRAVNRMVYHQWFPQVWLDMHQMQENGARMFVPPYTNPSSPNIPPLAHRTTDLLGTLMGMRMEERGRAGVGYGFAFDVYWPGSASETGYWKNTVGMLTEAASCRLATPVRVEPTELEGGEKGLSEYKTQVNFPNPWKGGAWRLRDILDYERTACDALLEGCALQRDSLLRNRARMALEACASVPAGQGYRIPTAAAEQRDVHAAWRLGQLLRENGAQVQVDSGGDLWVPSAQPLHRFLVEMLEPQRYPEIKPAPGAPLLSPYDVTAWNLPLLLGVKVAKQQAPAGNLRPLREGDGPGGGLEAGPAQAYALAPTGNAAAACVNDLLARGLGVRIAGVPFTAGGRVFPAGTALVAPGKGLEESARTFRQSLAALLETPREASVLKAPRLALYKPWWFGAEEGWTRLVLENHGFRPAALEPRLVQKGSLRKHFDVVVVPSLEKTLLVEGKPRPEDLEGWFWEEFPPEFRGGIGKEGATALKAFVEDGGTLVLLGQACSLAVDEWNLPLRNPIAKLKAPEFAAPGPLLNARRLQDHPVTWGIPQEFTLIPDGPLVLQTLPGPSGITRTALAAYPAEAQEVLACGWLKGADRLASRASAVALGLGKGRLVLLAFDPVFRAQSEGTFRFLLNAVHWGGLEP